MQSSSISRFSHNTLPGRLVGDGSDCRGDEEGERFYSSTGTGIGHCNKLRKVPSGSDSKDHLFGYGNRQCSFLGFSDSEKSQQFTKNAERISIIKGAIREDLVAASRAHVFTGKVCSGLKVAHETSAICSSQVLEQTSAVGQGPGTDLGFSVARFKMVGLKGKTKQGHSHPTEEPKPNTVIRRLSGGMGCNNRGDGFFRQVVRAGEPLAHQQFRITSRVERPESSTTSSMQQDHSNSGRQYHSTGLYSETRGHQVVGAVLPDKRNTELDRGEEYSSDSTVHQWGQEFNSRCPEPKKSNNSNRMDAKLRGMPTVVEDLGPTISRSFRNKVEQQAPELHVASPRRTGSGHRRHVAVLVQHGRLCVPSVRHDTSGYQQIQANRAVQNDVGSPMVATTGVVSRSPGIGSGHTKSIATQTRSAESTSGEASTPRPPHSSSDRLATVVRFGRAKNLSEEVSRQIFGARKASTNRLYQYRWSIYFKWCQDHKYSASRPSVNSLCEFFIYLKKVKKYATDSIRGFRSMLHTVLRHIDFNIRDNQDIADVIRSFQIQDPVGRKEVVPWNLDVVLRFLCTSRFEPINESSLVELTKKTLFLVTLALAKRVSEIQALSSSVGFSPEGALLSLVLGFRAKNDFKCKALPRNFLIKDLSTLVGQEEEVKLCPVRALRVYLERTKQLRSASNKRLFISPRDPSKPSSKNGISYLIKHLIKEAHRVLQPDLFPLLKVKPHEVRAVATSVSFEKNMSLETVMETAQWRCHSVFASHYLKEVSFDYGVCRTLGPFIAAGTVIP